jgi:hypothetical protein
VQEVVFVRFAEMRDNVRAANKESWRPRMPNFKLAIIIMTAHHPSRWHYRQILREQCLKNCNIPYKFIFGDPLHESDWGLTGLRDEEVLHSPGSDMKDSLVLKNQAGLRWALEEAGASHVLRLMDDTWVFVDRVLKSGLQAFDLGGNFPMKFKLGGVVSIPMTRMTYPHGGCGIWLSRKSAEKLIADKWNPDYLKSWPARMDVGMGITIKTPATLWDDMWLGEVLQGNIAYDDPLRDQPWAAYQANGISVYDDENLFSQGEPNLPICIHDPGVHKENAGEITAMERQIRHRNIAAAMAAARVPKEQIEGVAKEVTGDD